MRNKERKLVRDKRTGRLFESLLDAARYFKVSHQSIYNYCLDDEEKKGKPAKHFRVEWVSIRQLNLEMKKMREELKQLKKSSNQANVDFMEIL